MKIKFKVLLCEDVDICCAICYNACMISGIREKFIEFIKLYFKDVYKFNFNQKKLIMTKLKEELVDYEKTGVYSNLSKIFLDFLKFFSKNLSDDEKFAMDIMNNFPISKFKNIMIVAVGNDLELPLFLKNHGYKITVIDKCLNEKLLSQYKNEGINAIPGEFYCDDEKGDCKGTNIKDVNCGVAIAACGATEGMIRQFSKYDKPFILIPCNCIHNSRIDRIIFKNHDEYIRFLCSFSEKINYSEVDRMPIFTNIKGDKSDFKIIRANNPRFTDHEIYDDVAFNPGD